LSPEEGGSVSQFLLEFSSRAEFFHASSLSIDPPHCMTLVGQIIKGRELSVAFFSPHLARGRYRVNETAIKSWLRDQFPKRSQGLQARKLLEKVRLINIRHSAFFRILSKAVDSQKNYLDTRDERRLEPVSAQDVARALDLSPSTVSRVIAGKSFLLPWGVETPISALLPGRHQVLLIAVEKVLEKAAHSLTDAQLTAVVRKDFHLKVSRRSINACRHELKGLQHE
jgi:hypothetical protein